MNRKIAPPIKDAVEYKLQLKPYDLYYLDNGIPVYAINAGAQDVLQVELVLYAGTFYEQQKGIASATNFMLKNGTSSRTAFQLNEDFEYYGAYCTRACYSETAVLSLHTLTRHLEKLLPVMQDMLLNATFPDEELDIYKQNSKQRLKVNLQKCEFVAGRQIDSYLYGKDHPYGAYNEIADIDKVSTEELKKFYQQYYLNGSCAIFVAGNLPPTLKEQLNQAFGGLKLSKPSFIVPDIKASPAVEKSSASRMILLPFRVQ